LIELRDRLDRKTALQDVGKVMFGSYPDSIARAPARFTDFAAVCRPLHDLGTLAARGQQLEPTGGYGLGCFELQDSGRVIIRAAPCGLTALALST
jgi:hypothetical protein